ncbi:hypothetical protein ACHAWF_002937 [Thalassiosira exigua]
MKFATTSSGDAWARATRDARRCCEIESLKPSFCDNHNDADANGDHVVSLGHQAPRISVADGVRAKPTPPHWRGNPCPWGRITRCALLISVASFFAIAITNRRRVSLIDLVKQANFKSKKVEDLLPRKVYVVGIEHGRRNEMGHIWLDGIERSEKLQLTLNVSDASADWVFDFLRSSLGDLKEHLKASGRVNHAPTKSRIVMLDMSDGGYHNLQLRSLPLVFKYFGKENVYYATRQQIVNRNMAEGFRQLGFSKRTPFSDQGTRPVYGYGFKAETFQKLASSLGNPIGVLRYCVRSDIVKKMEVVSGNLTTLVSRSRPLDVASFWPDDSVTDPKSGIKSYLRTRVSRTVKALGQLHTLNVTVGLVGSSWGVGRNSVTDVYSQALIDHKIVVVAQRDKWEGHYRLMEALAGGSLVMTDPMHPLPYKLKDKDGLIVYKSLQELEKAILFYTMNPAKRLRIARRGHYIAMTYHRSWHVMERLLLGNWIKNNIY